MGPRLDFFHQFQVSVPTVKCLAGGSLLLNTWPSTNKWKRDNQARPNDEELDILCDKIVGFHGPESESYPFTLPSKKKIAFGLGARFEVIGQTESLREDGAHRARYKGN
jgi:hypothetical protein